MFSQFVFCCWCFWRKSYLPGRLLLWSWWNAVSNYRCNTSFQCGWGGNCCFWCYISVGFLIPDIVLVLCWSNFRFNHQFWLVSSPIFTCIILISSAFFFSLFLCLFKPWSFLPSTALIFILSHCSAFLFPSYALNLAVLSSLFCLSNFFWSNIAFCLFHSLSCFFVRERTNIPQICVYVPW